MCKYMSEIIVTSFELQSSTVEATILYVIIYQIALFSYLVFYFYKHNLEGRVSI